MIEIGQKIQDARKKRKLSIEQLSEKTKIRPYIISALEAGDFSIMPPVYIKSFLKTLKNELKIDDLEFPEQPKSKAKSFEDKFVTEPFKKETEKVFEDENNKKKIILDNTATSSNFSDLFKRKGVKKSSNTYFFNYIIYTVFAFALIAAVYFTFISMNSEEKSSNEIINKNENDTTVIKDNKDNLLSYFEKLDSISLVAKASDTAWMRINIDGKSNIELLMKPGMEEEWKAQEFFMIDQGNVGAVRYYRNGEPLQSFGTPGSVIKNVKITIDQVQNANIWKLDTARKNNTVPVTNPPKRKKPKTEEPKRRIILEESNFEKPDPFKKDKKPPNLD